MKHADTARGLQERGASSELCVPGGSGLRVAGWPFWPAPLFWVLLHCVLDL